MLAFGRYVTGIMWPLMYYLSRFEGGMPTPICNVSMTFFRCIYRMGASSRWTDARRGSAHARNYRGCTTSKIPRCVLGIRMGLSAPVAHRPYLEFRSVPNDLRNERTTKRVVWSARIGPAWLSRTCSIQETSAMREYGGILIYFDPVVHWHF